MILFQELLKIMYMDPDLNHLCDVDYTAGYETISPYINDSLSGTVENNVHGPRP